MAKPCFPQKAPMNDSGNVSAISCRGLSKRFRSGVEAVKDVTLEIPNGTLFGVIGADGAGKTTLIRMLATLLLPSSGKAEVLGLDVVKNFRRLRHNIGYMPGKFSLYTDLSVDENIKIFATLYGTTVKENYNLFGDIYEHLAPFGKRKAGKLSGGMKQKLALCCALVHRPAILLLDEPTTGVDPVSRKVFWDILSRLRNEEGMPILVSTPYMDEAFRCDRVALMQGGRIISEDDPGELTRNYPYALWGVHAGNKGALIKELRKIPGVRSVYSFGEELHLSFDEDSLSCEDIIAQARKKGFEDIAIRSIEPTIEDFFLAKTAEESSSVAPKESYTAEKNAETSQ